MFLGERTISSTPDIYSHGLINYTDTKMKCRHLKKMSYKGTLRQVFLRVEQTGETVSHVGIFDQALWTVAPLTFSLVQLTPPPPFPSSLSE